MAITRTVEIRTEIPGPRSRSILERKKKVVAEPVSTFFPIVVAHARGAILTDVDGNVFLDFTGGVGCLNVGHSHPRVVAAAQEQLARFGHTVFTEVPYEIYAVLAKRLVEIAPIARPAKAAFFNTGAEAIENAVKFARSYTRRPAVIVFDGAFHGRTLLAMTMTSKTSTKVGLAPFAPEVYKSRFRTIAATHEGAQGARADAFVHGADRAPTASLCAIVIAGSYPGRGRLHRSPARVPRRDPEHLR